VPQEILIEDVHLRFSPSILGFNVKERTKLGPT
jgi:hypothetical protein